MYQKLLLNSEKCRYNSFDIDTDNIEFYCPEFDSIGRYDNGSEYGTLNFTFKVHHIENENKNYKLLPIKCTKKIDDIKDNLAFRIFFVILGIELVYIIVINIFSCDKLRNFSMIAGLQNDKIIPSGNLNSTPPNKDSNSTLTDADSYNDKMKKLKYNQKNGKSKKKIKGDEIKIKNDDKDTGENEQKSRNNEEEYKQKSGNDEDDYKQNLGNNKKQDEQESANFIECFWENIQDLHPIISLARASVIQPLILQSWFLTFNVLNLFGFNALLYLESLIEERIYKPYRDNFAYPMRKEFGKIILSILCQVILCFLIKLIVLVSYNDKENLKTEARQYYESNEKLYIDNSIVETANKFEKKYFLKRLIGGLIMLIIVVFFF